MFAVLSLLLGIVASATPSSLWQEEIIRNFDDIDHYAALVEWRAFFGKEYIDAAEEEHRFLLFVENWRIINEHNLGGRWNYTMGLNQFGDLTQEEFLYQVHGHAHSCLRHRDDAVYHIDPSAVESRPTRRSSAPSAIDWTDINGVSYVTPIKDQSYASSTLCSFRSLRKLRLEIQRTAVRAGRFRLWALWSRSWRSAIM